MKRVIAYIDGFNLYFGLKEKGWRRYYWLNVQALASTLLKPGQQLVFTKYFTSRVIDNVDKQKRQTTFIEALETLSDFKIFYGKYRLNERVCQSCGSVDYVPNEKMSDVNIAVELLVDAFQDNFDVALLISADSDLTAALSSVKRMLPAKQIVVAFPPYRFSKDLAAITSHFVIGRRAIARSQFPETVRKADGFALSRPSLWQ